MFKYAPVTKHQIGESDGEENVLDSWESATTHQKAQRRRHELEGRHKEHIVTCTCTEEAKMQDIKPEHGGSSTIMDMETTPKLDMMLDTEDTTPAAAPDEMQLHEGTLEVSQLSMDNMSLKLRRQERSNESSNAGRFPKVARNC